MVMEVCADAEVVERQAEMATNFKIPPSIVMIRGVPTDRMGPNARASKRDLRRRLISHIVVVSVVMPIMGLEWALGSPRINRSGGPSVRECQSISV